MKKLLLFIVTFTLFAGCAAKQKDPAGVTYDFWMAQKRHNLEKARALSIEGDAGDVKIHPKIDIARITYGTPKIYGEEASVPTTLFLKDFRPGSDAEAKVLFDTKLKKTPKGWRIDTFETKKALYLAAGKAYAQNLSTAFAQSIRNFLTERGEIEGIFKKLLQGIKDAIDQSPKSN